MITYCAAVQNKLPFFTASNHFIHLSPHFPNSFSSRRGKCHVFVFWAIAKLLHLPSFPSFVCTVEDFWSAPRDVSSFPVTQLSLARSVFISHLSWLHPLGVAPSEKLPWEQEEHEDFLRVGCHIVAPWSIKSGGVTATCTHTKKNTHTHNIIAT